MTCTTKKCDNPPAVKVYWPGKVPPPVYCIACAAQAVNVLGHMGYQVSTTPITIDDHLKKVP